MASKVILYTDGSFLPSDPSNQIGFYGSAVHGYIYQLDNEKGYKPSSDKPDEFVITTDGYVDELNYEKIENKPELVNPTYYIDGSYSYLNKGTVNVAEILAVNDSLVKILEINTQDIDIKEIKLYTDSSYVLSVIHNIKDEKEEVWNKPNTPNLEYYKILQVTLEKFDTLGIKIEFNKIKAHAGHLGNELVDILAKFASKQSAHREINQYFYLTPAKSKYWVKSDKPHPLLNYKQLFFTNSIRADNKEIIYSILDYKSGAQPGEKTSKAGFGLVTLRQPPSFIEDVIRVYHKNMWNNRFMGAVSTLNLNNLYSRNTMHYNRLFGVDSFLFNNRDNILTNMLKDDIIYTIRPAGLAVQALERMQELYNILFIYRTGVENNVYSFIDITQGVYDIGENKKGEVVYDTKIPNGEHMLKVIVKFNGKELTIPLELGKDTITRNQFKALEKQTPKVTLAINTRTAEMLYYYTIIETKDGDYGIYCNFYSGKAIL